MDIINNLLIVAHCLLAIPTLLFAVQVFFARGLGDIEVSLQQPDRQSRVAVLVPAHNEENVIADTLKCIVPQVREQDVVLVVADNCSDHTAALAREYGVTVIERNDENQRGKGYALQYGLQYLANNTPPEIVIIVDADCQLSAACIDVLALRTETDNRPVQALDLMLANRCPSINLRIAEFAWRVKNQVRPLGFMRLGLPCQLMGTGMAFPWEMLNRVNLAHGNMVEDMKLGIDLALLGFPPAFCPTARVTSEFPESVEVADKQRKRWEHGHLATIMAEAPRLLKAAIQRREINLLAMALDLAVPPLTVLGLSLFILLSVSLLWQSATGNTTPFLLVTWVSGIFVLTVVMAWYEFARDILTVKTLFSVPFYMLRKIPLYMAFFIKRQQEWVKTERL